MSAAYLVQMLLPLRDNARQPFTNGEHAVTRQELVEKYGGLTAYQRAPARGLWTAEDGEVIADEVVVFEVLAPELDRAWWARYRTTLLRRFRQESILLRAMPLEVL